MSNANWTKPYYGVMHLGQMADKRWASVIDRGAFAELFKSGMGITDTEATYDTVEQAKAAGEAWVATGADLQDGMWIAANAA